ncbi:unnamed protein product [Cuscuta campestris]|uniref:DUF4283 domain-containing protein n=1 Tax=Cuscuta campestris TaxID=132261 RepID=A0A484N4L4_9ASTE|nr:unnamed protein product [Cuscuta campestris]
MNTPVRTASEDSGKKETLRDEEKGDMEKDGQIAVEEEPSREPPDEGLQVPPKSYAEAVGDKEELDCKVHFIAAIEHNGCKIAKMTKDDTVEASTYWETAIPMCILGANPPIEVVEGFAKRIWEQADILDVTMLKPRQFVVHFEYEVLASIVKMANADNKRVDKLILFNDTIKLFDIVDVVKTEHLLVSPRANTYMLRVLSHISITLLHEPRWLKIPRVDCSFGLALSLQSRSMNGSLHLEDKVVFKGVGMI